MSMMPESPSRNTSLERLRQQSDGWDLLVIGGGATGSGIALDAASRGLEVLLLEQSDFGKGTSSRSTKLIHGGVRYLQQGNLTLVKDALQERSRLLKNAPHLVQDLSFLVPCHNHWERFYYGTGLKAYDFLAVRDSFGASRWATLDELKTLVPGLKRNSLKGAVLYHDGQFDDARLLICMLRTAQKHHACLLNYVSVNAILKDQSGRVIGVRAEDQETGELFEPLARCVINAAGPFSDQVRSLDDVDCEPLLRPSQGVHLVVSKEFYPGNTALMVPKTPDGRVIFFIPWNEHVIIGTTDTAIPEAVLEPTPQEQEIQFLMETSGQYLARPLERDNILSIYTGIRPLVKNMKAGKTASLSRDHTIRTSKSGLLTIVGGKWTTVRKMAEDCVDRAVKQANLSARPCQSKDLKLHGYVETKSGNTPRAAYGTDLQLLEQLEKDHPELALPYCDEFTLRPSEVLWSVRQEMARTVEDVLARRSRTLFLNAAKSLAIAPQVALCVAQELEQDEHWIRDQLVRFESVAQHFLP